MEHVFPIARINAVGTMGAEVAVQISVQVTATNQLVSVKVVLLSARTNVVVIVVAGALVPIFVEEDRFATETHALVQLVLPVARENAVEMMVVEIFAPMVALGIKDAMQVLANVKRYP